MTYRKKVDAQHAHISSLRLIIGLLVILGLYMAYGWQSAPRDLTIHVPPDLRSGSTRHWWDVPTESVYAFGFYIFQQINRWPNDGEVDYEDNITRLGSYLTPSCKAYLQKDFELRRNSGELRRRERGVSEIPGRGLNDTSVQRIETLSINDWTVNLDIIADEHYGGEIVKRTGRAEHEQVSSGILSNSALSASPPLRVSPVRWPVFGAPRSRSSITTRWGRPSKYHSPFSMSDSGSR